MQNMNSATHVPNRVNLATLSSRDGLSFPPLVSAVGTQHERFGLLTVANRDFNC
jgi:hypothetical protein